MKSELTAAAMPDVEAPIEAPAISREKPASARLEEQERRALEETWKDPPGFRGRLTSTNHKAIGRRYIITVFKMRAPGMSLNRIPLVARHQLAFQVRDANPSRLTLTQIWHPRCLLILSGIPAL